MMIARGRAALIRIPRCRARDLSILVVSVVGRFAEEDFAGEDMGRR